MRFEILYAIKIIARVCAGALTKGDVVVPRHLIFDTNIDVEGSDRSLGRRQFSHYFSLGEIDARLPGKSPHKCKNQSSKRGGISCSFQAHENFSFGFKREQEPAEPTIC
jgi:hypothetical protein